jgi:hypothetical protein
MPHKRTGPAGGPGPSHVKSPPKATDKATVQPGGGIRPNGCWNGYPLAAAAHADMMRRASRALDRLLGDAA